MRVGPNVLDVDLPEIVKPAFSDIKSDWQKVIFTCLCEFWDFNLICHPQTDFYHSSSAKVNGKLIFNLFSETDGKKHGKEKKPVAKYYTQVAVRALEPHVDAMISKLCQALDSRFAEGGKAFDLGQWLLFCMSHASHFSTVDTSTWRPCDSSWSLSNPWPPAY